MLYMALHHRHGIAHQAKGHMNVLAALMFNHHIDIAIAFAGLYRPLNIGVEHPQFFIDKAGGFQF